MRGTVVVEDQAGFDAWIAQQPVFAPLAAGLQ
jgi:heme/copper-type cytochrome/quinol oxidase subunit 2